MRLPAPRCDGGQGNRPPMDHKPVADNMLEVEIRRVQRTLSLWVGGEEIY